jgi:hypothetical protein
MIEEDVVHNCAVGVGEQAVMGLPHGHLGDVAGLHVLQEEVGLRPFGPKLAHVVDVEEAGGGAHGLMLGQGTGGILDRQFVPGKGHHASAHSHMGVVEVCALHRLGPFDRSCELRDAG